MNPQEADNVVVVPFNNPTLNYLPTSLIHSLILNLPGLPLNDVARSKSALLDSETVEQVIERILEEEYMDPQEFIECF